MLTGAQVAAHPVRPRCLMIPITLFLFSLICCKFSLAQPEIASQALLKFKSSLGYADPTLISWNPSVPPCPPRNTSLGNWAGVLCFNGYVWGLQLENMNLQGQIDVDALVSLHFLRALSFMNNNFEGKMPDWRKLGALKSLYLSNNRFSGHISEDAFKGMASLKKVHLANNRFTGPIPVSLESPKLIELRLENNQFTGTIPPISSEFLKNLNVSNNQLQGQIPTPLANLNASSFSGNRALCGKPLETPCDPPIPPPDSEPNLVPPATSPSPSPSPSTSTSIPPTNSSSSPIIGIIIVCVVVAFILLILLVLLYRRNRKSTTPKLGRAVSPNDDVQGIAAVVPGKHPPETMVTGAVPPKKAEQQQPGKLTFVRDDRHKFDLQDLMRASAEVLGSGNFGASYKAVLVDGEALVVKRFKQMNAVAKEDFHEHMRRLGRLNHPNLLPLVAYLYRKEEKLLVFDHVQNGSLATRLHGKRSEEKPVLSWVIRLRIIKGVAKGLTYLQNELSSLTVPHGHLKSSNVLLDKDYNPLLMDYTLVPIVNPTQVQQILVAYKSPEYAKLGHTTNKTDVWCLGILILEILTGKLVAKYFGQDSGLYGTDLAGWVNDIVHEAKSCETQVFDKEMNTENSCESKMEKLLNIGIACCREDPEERLDLVEAVEQIEQIQDTPS